MNSPINILLFSDFHNAIDLTNLEERLSSAPSPDIIFTLGDISAADLIAIKEIAGDSTPIYGLRGNHDSPQALELAGVPNLHGKLIEFAGLRFTGFEGSVRYKRGSHIMYSQKESLVIAKSLPSADILISHDKAFRGKRPLFWPEYSKDPHEGMIGISDYLQKHSPILHIHGHIHSNMHYNPLGTETVSVYGIAVISVSSQGLETLQTITEP